MPVTLNVMDLVQPDGELDDSFFPDDNLDDYLTGWLQQATAKVNANTAIQEANAAAAAYVYWRAYQFLATRYNTLAQTTSIAGEISHTVTNDQVEFYQQQADLWAGRYAAHAGGVTAGDLLAQQYAAKKLIFTVS